MQKIKILILGILVVFVLAIAPAWAERMAITGEIANVRSGPGTKYDVLWQVGKYHPISVTAKRGNWYQFKDFEGDSGWIHESLVGKVSTVITRKTNCNIRSGPGTNNNVLFTAESGVPFKVRKRKGQWLNIVHADGDAGWIHKSLVW